MRRLPRLASVVAALCCSLSAGVGTGSSVEEAAVGHITVFTAKRFITMEPALSEATAVAVAGGRIVAVGDLDSLTPWTSRYPTTIDRSFADKYVMPGFIDPHVHPSLPAITTQFPYIAPEPWKLPTGHFPAARSPEQYEQALRDAVAAHDDPAVPFVTWGYHPLWHGEVFRDTLDVWFPERPVILWHRSFHELIANSTALRRLGLREEDSAGDAHADWSRGLFSEGAAMQIMARLTFVFEPARFGRGMRNFAELLHLGGVTTAVDMGFGISGNPEADIAAVRSTLETMQAPSRVIMTPIITSFLNRGVTPEAAMKEIEGWRNENSRRVLLDHRFKLMIDGAVFSGLSQFGFPGYIDGHEGVWMVPLETTLAWAQFFWDAGYQLHAHTNGDASAARMIHILRTLLANTPRIDHRFSLEHFAYTTEDQNRALKNLGAVVSANPYYHYILSDIYSAQWLGPDRGEQMVRLGSLERLGVPFTLHSDMPMAPLSPLTLAWTATNRVTINGNRTGQSERVSLDAALRAITIGAAYAVGWEDEIGSIRAGKRADFTVLDEDPYEAGAGGLKDISVWGTVFEGEVAPLKRTP